MYNLPTSGSKSVALPVDDASSTPTPASDNKESEKKGSEHYANLASKLQENEAFQVVKDSKKEKAKAKKAAKANGTASGG